MKRLVFLLMAAASAVLAVAQKSLYIPAEWKNPWPADSLLYAENDPTNQYTWSKSRSRESDNVVVYWDKGYGATVPTDAPSDFRVDIDDLLAKAESYYAKNVGELCFCDESDSKLSRYKVMVLLNHTTDWVCYGGGYDNTIAALWLSPSTCKPVGHSVAHEVGHSFQYQCYSDLGGYTGFRTAIGNGSAFWEQTAQWQANQSYPELKWSQSWGLFRQTANYAMTHEWMRYQSYWWLYYLADKYGLDIVGRLWRHDPKKASDPNESLMSLMQWDVNRLYKEYFDYAMKMATLDLSVTRNEADPYIGTLDYHYVPLGGTAYQVTYASCPQASGFNVVPLNVPEAGTEVTVDFTSLKAGSLLAEGDPVEYFDGNSMAKLARTRYNSTSSYTKRGFRLGFVALMADGTRQYMAEDSVYCASGMSDRSCQVGCVVPEGVERLFLVVSPAPAVYYQHQWDEDITNDDQFPYTITLTGSNILGAPVLDDRLPLTDATLTFDVTFPASSDYSGASVTIDGEALSALGTAFQLQGSQLDATMTAWSATVPDDGKTKFYACNSLGKIVNQGSTANGYGHWFNASGARCDYGNGYVFSEFDPATLTFSIGQFPNRLQNGQTYTIRQALKHRRDVVGDDGSMEKQYGLVTFVFRIRVTDDAPAGGTLVRVEQDPIVTPVHNVTPDRLAPPAYYSLSGQRLQRPRRGVTIVRQSDGTARKIINE